MEASLSFVFLRSLPTRHSCCLYNERECEEVIYLMTLYRSRI